VRAARLDSPDEDIVIARVTPLGREGLRIDGLAQGSGVLYVQVDGREELFTLFVTPTEPGIAPAGVFTPGWRFYKQYDAGTEGDQRRYHQHQSLSFGGGGEGNKVGCGPCAWTMLMGWWDLKGVPVIFRPYWSGSGLPGLKLGSPDAPPENTYWVEDTMTYFRGLCDPLFCDVVTGQCGTPPGQMVDGINHFGGLCSLYNPLYYPFIGKNLLGYSYTIKETSFPKNGVNEFNKLARESIRDGYPSLIGVGWLSHYVVAFKYIEHRYELAPGYFPYYRAWFQVNWGNGGANYLVKFTDTEFFATKCHFWQSTTNFVAP
jgi:hypothetical protein